MHRWSEQDDLCALYVYLFGTAGLPYSVETIARRRGIDPGSFKMRVGNFKAIAGAGGLANFARQSQDVFRAYGRKSQEQLKEIAFPELSHG